jgi:RNA polymerase sigma-70 factor (ECF subfamily)
VAPPATLSPSTTVLLERLVSRSSAARWGVSPAAMRAAVERSIAHRFPEGADAGAEARYLKGLHLDDLALATACAGGHAAAWDHFVAECRPALYAAARVLTGDAYRELADSLYAELYGLSDREGHRRSLLTYFHGRSRLTTWLRSVLVQRHIDRLRADRRLESLDEEREPGTRRSPAPAADPPNPYRREYVAWAQAALDSALDALASKDRLRLRLYYGQDLTLARIGRLLGEHEATVSRQLNRSRKQLKRHVERTLRERHGLADEAVRECVALAAESPEIQLDRLLSAPDDG